MKRTPFRALPWLLALAILAPISIGVLAGNDAAELPQDATLEGDWFGTWIYASRDHRFAAWIQMDGKRPEIKFRFQAMGSGESFITDWRGQATYHEREGEGVFSFKMDQGDADQFSGQWDWELVFPTSSRTESSPVRGYRANDGRDLRIEFQDHNRTLVRGGRRMSSDATFVWSFRKVSRRHILWDELPF
ncbi:MAG: hypothetical protein OEV00_13975 [Acidobacteriota bacterium]|nr:hypothetical protein [Acidobacteriota bacterium]MDH3786418.1 hypothetical protein [Acidobacteriota bacterium]